MPAEIASGTVPTQTIKQGNTLPARQFTYSLNGNAPTITAAFFAVKTPAGVQLLRVPCTIAGAVVTRPAVAATVTATWPPGRLNWDIETTVSLQEKTWIEGQLFLKTTAQ